MFKNNADQAPQTPAQGVSEKLMDMKLQTIRGESTSMKDLMKGNKLSIICNVASKWSFAHKGYTELVNLYNEYSDHGLTVIAFPSNQFLSQEPGSNKEIEDYARVTMKAQFPLMDKCDVNGKNAHPVWKYIRKNIECFNNPQTGKIRNIPWNFSKFLVDENGNIIAYLNPRQSLYTIIDQIEVMIGLK